MFTVQEIITATGGTIVYGKEDRRFTGVSIDSRTIQPNELFVCITGEQYDGHDFISHAVNAGAEGVIISDRAKWDASKGDERLKVETQKLPIVIIVDNTLDALGDIARFHRGRFNIPVIGITGSNGKTTTKEMTAAILETTFHTFKNKGNYNNLIGVPLSLFNLTSDHKAAVIEMGMNRSGEIKRLCDIAHPTMGIVTNICEAHREQFTSLHDIQKEKEELVRFLGFDSTAILNCDDPLVYEMNQVARGKVVTYGMSNSPMVTAEQVEKDAICRYSFTLRLEKKSIPVHVPLSGYHNIYNAISAAAAGMAMNIEIDNIKKGIESCSSPPMRAEITQKGGIIIINDTYNANPASVEAALMTLLQVTGGGRKVFIFGDMLELGEVSHDAHSTIGRKLVKAGVDITITAGEWSKVTGEQAINAGMPENCVVMCKDAREALDAAVEYLKAGDVVLVKGSRGMRMETVANGLAAHCPFKKTIS